MKTLRFLAFFFCFVMLIGCVNTEQLYDDFAEQQNAQVPNEWVNQFIAGSVSSNWLMQFGDKQLAELVSNKLIHNTQVRLASARVLTSYQRVLVTSGGRLPSIDLALRATRTAANNADSTIYSNLFSTSVQMTWNVDLWNATSSDVRAQLLSYQSSFSAYLRVLNTTAASIAKAWFSLISEQQLIAIDTQNLDRSKKWLDELESNYRIGLSTAYDYHNQKARVVSDSRLLDNRHLQFRQSLRNLENLLGDYPTAKLKIPTDLPPVVANDVPAGLPSELLQRRADLLAAQADVQASYERIAIARANRYPSLSITASAGRSSNELNELTNNDITSFSLGGSLLVPLFNFGKLKASEQLAVATAQQQEVTFNQKLMQAFLETERALDNNAALADMLQLAHEEAELYAQAATVAETEYSAGIISFFSYSSAENNRSNAIARLVNLQKNLITNRIDLYLALGGNFLTTSSESPWLIVDEDGQPLQQPKDTP